MIIYKRVITNEEFEDGRALITGRVLSVGVQKEMERGVEKMVVWFVPHPLDRQFLYLLLTGHDYDIPTHEFIGTVQLNEDLNPFIIHCFKGAMK